jgi:hypothetical protein
MNENNLKQRTDAHRKRRIEKDAHRKRRASKKTRIENDARSLFFDARLFQAALAALT